MRSGSIKDKWRLTPFILVLTLIAGCPSVPRQNASAYPQDITNRAESADFPLRAGPYTRDKMLVYRPDMKDRSIAYNAFDAELQNAVTLYFYPLDHPLAEQFESERQAILRAHKDCVQTGEKRITLSKDGVTYTALVATFKYDEVFAHQQQTISSQLVIVPLPDHYFKVRSSAPIAQGAMAETGMLALLDRVGWTH
jgi:hypothetical protein